MIYVTYNPTNGGILSWGSGMPPVGFEYLEVTEDRSYENDRVDLGLLEVVPKIEMSLTLPSAPTPADGVSEAVIGGLPEGVACDFYLGGEPVHADVTDGTLEIAAFDPQVVRVRFWHPIYQHAPVEVEFV